MRLSLKILAGTVLATVLLIAALYFALRSEAVNERLLRLLQPLIEQKSGFEVRAKRVSLDLLDGIALDDLHLRRRGESPLAVSLGRLRLHYSFTQLLRGNLDISTLEIRDLKLKGKLHPTASSAASEPGGSSTSPLAPLLKQLDAGEPEVTIRRIAVAPVAVELKLENDQQHVQLQGIFALHGSFERRNAQLRGEADFNASDITVHLRRPDREKRLDLQIAQYDTALNLALRREHNASDAPSASIYHRVRFESRLQQAHLRYTAADSTALGLQCDHNLSFESRGDTHLPSDTAEKPQITAVSDLRQHLALHAFSYRDGNLSAAVDRPLFERLQAHTQGRIDLDALQKSAMQWRIESRMPQAALRLEQAGRRLHFAPRALTLSLQGRSNGTPAGEIENRLHLAMAASALSFHDTNAGQSLETTPKYTLTLDSRLHPLSEHNTTRWQPVSATLHQRLDLAHTALSIPESNLTFDSAFWQAESTYDPSQLQLKNSLSARRLAVPLLSAPLSPALRFTLKGTPGTRTAQLYGTLTPQNDMPLLSFDLEAADRPGSVGLDAALKLDLDPGLQQWFAQARALQKLGPVQVALQSRSRLDHGAKTLRDANLSALRLRPFQSENNLTLSQLQPPSRANTYLARPLHLRLTVEQNVPRHYRASLALRSEGVRYPPLKKALPVSLDLATEVDERLTAATLRTDAALAHRPLFHSVTALENRPKHLLSHSRFDLFADPAWQAWLPRLKPLEPLATLHLNAELELNTDHPYGSIVDFDPAHAMQDITITGDLNGTLAQSNATEHTRLRLSDPLRFEQRFDYSTARISADARYRIGDLVFDDILHLHGNTLHLSAEAENGIRPERVTLRLHAGDGNVTVQTDKNSTLDATALLLPLSLSLDAHRTPKRAVFKPFEFSLGGGWLTQKLHAEATLDGKAARAGGTLRFTPRAQLLPGFSGSGSMTLPWRASVLNARQFSLHGEAVFDDMTLNTPRLELAGLHGRIPFNEALQRHKDGTFSFSYLLTPEPFQRVDFERIEPYLHAKDRLGASSLRVGDIQAAPLAAVIGIDQNLLQLQQFTVGILGGYLTGRFYVNAAPGNYTVGLLGRLSRIDLRQLLPDAKAFDAAPINARVALQFDLNQRLLEGRIDITDINRPQLLQLLELLDPDHTDPQLEQLRSALRLGHPEYVSVSMHQGLLDLDVGVSLLAEPIRVRGIGLSVLLQHFAGPYLEKLNHLPLE